MVNKYFRKSVLSITSSLLIISQHHLEKVCVEIRKCGQRAENMEKKKKTVSFVTSSKKETERRQSHIDTNNRRKNKEGLHNIST